MNFFILVCLSKILIILVFLLVSVAFFTSAKRKVLGPEHWLFLLCLACLVLGFCYLCSVVAQELTQRLVPVALSGPGLPEKASTHAYLRPLEYLFKVDLSGPISGLLTFATIPITVVLYGNGPGILFACGVSLARSLFFSLAKDEIMAEFWPRSTSACSQVPVPESTPQSNVFSTFCDVLVAHEGLVWILGTAGIYGVFFWSVCVWQAGRD